MAIVVNPEPGVVLVGEFDKADPAAAQELELFGQRLVALQKQQGFEAFVPLIKKDARRLSITIVPCSLGAAGAITDAASLGQLAQDSFRGSGHLPPQQADALEQYDAKGKDAADLSSSWFQD